MTSNNRNGIIKRHRAAKAKSCHHDYVRAGVLLLEERCIRPDVPSSGGLLENQEYIYVYRYTHVPHTHVHTYVHKHMHVDAHTYVCIQTHIHHTCTYTHMYAHACMHIHMHTHAHTHVPHTLPPYLCLALFPRLSACMMKLGSMVLDKTRSDHHVLEGNKGFRIEQDLTTLYP